VLVPFLGVSGTALPIDGCATLKCWEWEYGFHVPATLARTRQ
jgi:hypothetical protein